MSVNKIDCPICGQHTCFEETHEGTTGWMCFTCGYTTNTMLEIGSEALSQAEETTAKLIRDLRYEDTDRNLVWFLSVIQTPMGMVFPNGDMDDWHWSYAPVVEVSEEEKEKYPVPNRNGEFFTKRLGVELIKSFEKTNFIGACRELGIADLEEIDDAETS